MVQKMEFVNLFPMMVNNENTVMMDEQISEEELLQTLKEIAKNKSPEPSTLKEMAKNKSPEPDGWHMEFFLHFFELMGLELVMMVEVLRCSGHISGAINSTLLILISKKSNSISLLHYRPLSLCNAIYKMIFKIIANRVKNIISPHISLEQFGFLSNKRIQDAMTIAQECIHLVKTRKLDFA